MTAAEVAAVEVTAEAPEAEASTAAVVAPAAEETAVEAGVAVATDAEGGPSGFATFGSHGVAVALFPVPASCAS
jgi:hypothetical protein